MGELNQAVHCRRLTRALDEWFQRAAGIGAHLEYQIEGMMSGQDGGEEQISELLDIILPSVTVNCQRLDPSDRWISLCVQIRPESLELECASAGKYFLESGKIPDGVSSIQLIQNEDSYQLQIRLERRRAYTCEQNKSYKREDKAT